MGNGKTGGSALGLIEKILLIAAPLLAVGGWVASVEYRLKHPEPIIDISNAPEGTILAFDTVIHDPVTGDPTSTTRKIPDGWVLCDGKNGTPNLEGRFLCGGLVAGKKGDPTTKSGVVDTEKVDLNNHNHELPIVDLHGGIPTIQAAGPNHDKSFKVGNRASSIPVFNFPGATSTTSGGEDYYQLSNNVFTGNKYNMNEHIHSIDATPSYYTVVYIMRIKK